MTLVDLLPIIFNVLSVFVKNIIVANVNNPSLLAEIQMIVHDIGVSHPDWTNDEKHKYARDAIVVHLHREGKVLRTAAIDTLISLFAQQAP